MRFVVDECCHRAFVVGLRDAGHDVRYAAETDIRATDAELTALAIAEDRIVITADYDFGELAVRRREPIPGVLLLAPSEVAIADKVERIVSIVANDRRPPQRRFDDRRRSSSEGETLDLMSQGAGVHGSHGAPHQVWSSFAAASIIHP